MILRIFYLYFSTHALSGIDLQFKGVSLYIPASNFAVNKVWLISNIKYLES